MYVYFIYLYILYLVCNEVRNTNFFIKMIKTQTRQSARVYIHNYSELSTS